MTRTRYQQNLDLLKENVIKIGEEARKSIDNAMIALEDLDVELANKVIEDDQVIDELDDRIEKCVHQLIARQAPTAGDMRFVTSCLKTSIDVERMADMAVDIAAVVKRIDGEHAKPISEIMEMGTIASLMLEQAITAFKDIDPELAKKTAKEDDKVDELFSSTSREIIEMMASDKTIIDNASHLLFVLRYLERIGDHACNICESVVYMASGERVYLN